MNWTRGPIYFRGDVDGGVSNGPPELKEADRLEWLAILPVWKTGQKTDLVECTGPAMFPDAWAIIHIPTMVVFAFTLSKEKAQAFCERAETELGDWWGFCYHRDDRGNYIYPSKHGKEETMERVHEFNQRMEDEGLLFGPKDRIP